PAIELDYPAPQLDRRKDLRRLRLAEPVDLAEVRIAGPRESGEPVEGNEQARCEVEHVLGGCAGAEEDGQQLDVADSVRSGVPQPLARAVAAGKIVDGQTVLAVLT